MCRLEIKQRGTALCSQAEQVACLASRLPVRTVVILRCAHPPCSLQIPPTGFPVLLCGQFASEMSAAAALRNMLRVAAMPVVTTFQACACVCGVAWGPCGVGVLVEDHADLLLDPRLF